ncbi:hypothetical protein PSQ40_14185 [Curvibacter sp. HBC61]|uniref:Uncharacterized protein n=1 Tax=Curvibacter cyanobacteriorum TaxID=3026422 RepID=A0ABT5N086_9BURK|nr:hypothetical protein [Curvibacter sp. HBC61]MDD0839731.1 hypothetical protein [Curvibacter sp. HBC61]
MDWLLRVGDNKETERRPKIKFALLICLFLQKRYFLSKRISLFFVGNLSATQRQAPHNAPPMICFKRDLQGSCAVSNAPAATGPRRTDRPA